MGGTEDFQQLTQIHQSGGFEEITVITPNGPQRMQKYQADMFGLPTKEQHDFKKQQEAEQVKSKEKQDEINADRRSMMDGAKTVRTESGAALQALRDAKLMLETEKNEAVRTMVRPNLTGRHGGWAQSAGFNQRRDALQGKLDAIESMIAIDKIQQMKNQSSTGATGFGSLSAPELTLLTSVRGSLDLNKNDPDTLLTTLNSLQVPLEKILYGGYIPGDTETTPDGRTMIFMGGDPNNLDNWESF